MFEKYDIVILCENLHTEDTQWDFIYDVVTDTLFVEKVGNIFTEYGRAKDQAKVDSFMKESFHDSVSLAKAAATLMNYHSGNFYFFMQKLYKFNRNLPDSLQVQEHFTDVFSWKYLVNTYSDTLLNNIDILLGNGNRDSLMAQVIIDWYQKTRKKCLVVTNYRHAFAVKNENNSKIYDDEAQYIYNQFPEKTANVMIHGSCYNYLYHTPIQNGIWNRAMKNNGNIPVGFDFKGSPFGNDRFDRYPTFRRRYNCRYQDIFTGYVFYKPEEKYTHSQSFYKKYAAKKEYEWAIENCLIDSAHGRLCLETYQNTGGKRDAIDLMVLYLNTYHFIDLLIWGLWAVMAALVAVCSFLQNNREKTKSYVLEIYF